MIIAGVIQIDQLRKIFAISGRASWIGIDRDIALCSKALNFSGKIRTIHGRRAAMNFQYHRKAAVWAKIRGQGNPRFYLSAVVARRNLDLLDPG